jgi:hypothetical protein
MVGKIELLQIVFAMHDAFFFLCHSLSFIIAFLNGVKIAPPQRAGLEGLPL